MKQKDIITFDTNFLINKKSDIHKMITNMQSKYIVIIMNLVIEEMKGQKVRSTLKEYNKIIEQIEKNKFKNNWISIIDNTDIDSVIKEQEEKISQWMKRIFGKNIIHIDMNNFIEKLLERCKYKKPPFNDDENASDKGFKDTLLFMSLIEYAKSLYVNKIFLLTLDSAFKKYKKDLEEEFEKETGKKLIIIYEEDKCQLYKILDIEIQENDELNEQEINEEIFPNKPEIQVKEQDCIESIQLLFEDLTNSTKYSFYTHKILTEGDIKIFLDNIDKNIEKFIFLENIPINNLINIESYYNETVKLNTIKIIRDIYNLLDEKSKTAYIFAICTKFNEYYTELPF